MKPDIFKVIRTMELFSNEAIIRWTKAFDRNIGLSPILVLVELRKKGPQKQTVLATSLGYTPGAITNTSTKLVKEQYAERLYNEEDRRNVLLKITPKGEALLEEAREVGEALYLELFSVLDDEELNQLLYLYEKMVKNLELEESKS
ncbi:MarR family winged helix-turn-helix transcriptional regulator [Psychrobacillus vulpis]|uniref:MarR family transcriptional regulator n=1 Tax=Psychrobacillus vulpis TaxID=2325572 RepID=A0A544TW07_9BACI|nr:MarR family transcriptional regulator [Psychrobacillus vulpis]TQR21626.1 MarR family transcriptional regulator [Psychrobacillus vulpis]